LTPTCPKCRGTMKEHKTDAAVAEGLRPKMFVANICDDCGFVELWQKK